MSQTRIVRLDPSNPQGGLIGEASGILRQGGLVILPTETVYGIAANMLDRRALERLYKIKQRPQNKPFSVHIADKERVEEFASAVPVCAYKLIAKFWPGPLTLILNSSTAGTVGLRMPDNQFALNVIAAAQAPIVMPSANLAGKPAPVDFSEAIKDMDGLVDLAVDSGRTKLAQESTIADLTLKPIKIIRQGVLKEEDIRKLAAVKNILFVCTGNSCRSVMAEAYLKKLLAKAGRKDVEVYSAGISALPGAGATQEAREILREFGMDVSGHRAQRVTRQLIRQSDLVLVMEKIHEQSILETAPEAKNRLFLLKEFAKINDNNLNVSDPIGMPLHFYEQTFSSIKEAVERIAEII